MRSNRTALEAAYSLYFSHDTSSRVTLLLPRYSDATHTTLSHTGPREWRPCEVKQLGFHGVSRELAPERPFRFLGALRISLLGFSVFWFGAVLFIWFGTVRFVLRGLGFLGYATLRVHGTGLVCGSSL